MNDMNDPVINLVQGILYAITVVTMITTAWYATPRPWQRKR